MKHRESGTKPVDSVKVENSRPGGAEECRDAEKRAKRSIPTDRFEMTMMNTAVIAEPAGPNEPISRVRSGDAEAFAALLLDAQSVSVVAAASGIVDASGMGTQGAGDEPDAQRARIEGETADARQAEAQQRRGETPTQTDAGADRMRAARNDAVREAEQPPALSNSAMRGNAGQTGSAANSPTVEPAISMGSPSTDRADHGSDGSTHTSSVKASEVKVADHAPAETQQSGSKESPTASPVVHVPTAGAAQRAEGQADAGKSTAAHAVARLLAARVEPARVDAPTQLPAQSLRDGQTSQARPSYAAPREQQDPAGRSSGASGTGPTRRADFEQLVRLVRMNLGNRDSSATLRLDPPELGRIKVDVRMSADVLHLRVEVDNPHARELLSERVEHLSEALRAHDIRMERFEIVSVEASDEQARDDAQSSLDPRDPSQGSQGETHQSARRTSSELSDGIIESEGSSPVSEVNTTAQLDVRI